MSQMEPPTSSHSPVRGNTVLVSDELLTLLPTNWPRHIPLARITTCGRLTIEVVHRITSNSETDGHFEVVYGPPDAKLLAEKGTAKAFILLALLASQPGCFATKDFLSEKLGRQHEEEDEESDTEGLKRVDNVVSRLRRLLYPPMLDDLPGAKLLRRGLVTFNSATTESGPGYRLCGTPLIWLDVEVIRDYGKRARALEQFGRDGGAEWQRCYDLSSQGPFLSEEPYSDWASWRRQEVEKHWWDSVQVLWRRSVQQGEAGEAEALRLLRDYWLAHITNEDALRPLLELLCKQECFGQAQQYYDQLSRTLTAEGKQPDRRTIETMEFVQAVQIGRENAEKLVPIRPVNTKNEDVEIPLPFIEEENKQLQAQASKYHPLPQIWNVPHQRNPFFMGREELLIYLHELFNNREKAIPVSPCALCGLGGIGKTQTVLEYAYRYSDEYDAIFWIKADTRENLLADWLTLARVLHLPEQVAQDQDMIIAAVKRWLREHSHWLLIFDNADDLTLVREFFSLGHQGHILLTTRMQAMGGIAHRIELEVMNLEVGTLFLLRRAGIISPFASLEEAVETDCILAREIVQTLDALPLALDQAGAYIEETSSSLQEYIQIYQKRRWVLLNKRGGLATDHPEPVTMTWSLSFQRIEQLDPLAADLLRLCAFLDPDMIPEEVIDAGIQTLGSFHEVEQEDSLIRVNEILGVLLDFSLIKRNAEIKMLSIHRLVQTTIQDSMSKDLHHTWVERAEKIVRQAFPYESTVYSTSGYPHRAVQLLKVSIHKDLDDGNKKHVAAELWKLAVQQQVLGRLKASEQSLKQGLRLCHETGDCFNGAKIHQYFALLRAYQGDFPASVHHLETAVSLFKEAQAIGLESTLAAYRSLSALLAGDVKTAFIAAKAAWEYAKTGREERDMIRAQWVLGNTLVRLASQETGSQITDYLQQAATHLREALERCQQSQIIDYEADILLAWARLHYVKGDYAQAQTFATEALAITHSSSFRVLRADVHILLAHIALDNGNRKQAVDHAQAAFNDALCDGISYCYQPALEEAKRLLAEGKKRSEALIPSQESDAG